MWCEFVFVTVEVIHAVRVMFNRSKWFVFVAVDVISVVGVLLNVCALSNGKD